MTIPNSTRTGRPVFKRLYSMVEGLQLVKSADNKPYANVHEGSVVLSTGNPYESKPGMLLVSVRAISARINQNFDGFPSAEIKKAASTFIGRPVFINHNNEDHRRSRGIILDSAYKEAGDDKYVELLIEVDANAFPKLASYIVSGELDSVSMGCDVDHTKCSFCDNIAHDVKDFCDHVRYNKGQKLSRIDENGNTERVLVSEKCYGLNFFEISFVFDPADETAISQRVYLPKQSRKVASVRRTALGETTSPETVDTLRDQQSCPECGDEGFDGKQCDLCDYSKPPEEFDDPDTMKSRVLQIVRNNPEGPTGKEGKYMGTTPTRLQMSIHAKRLQEAQRRIAEDLTTDDARQQDLTDVTDIDSGPLNDADARSADEVEDVQQLPDPKNQTTAERRKAYLQSKRVQADDPTMGAPDPQAGAPSDSDGPNSGPPSSDTPGEAGIEDLPIDWKQDESGEPYGTVQGTGLDIFVNEDMSWQVLPEGSQDPVAEGQGASYDDCVHQAFEAATQLAQQASQDPAAGGDPSQQGPPPGADPSQDPTKMSSRRKTSGPPPEAKPDVRTDVEDLPDYNTMEDDGGTFSPADYDNNAGNDLAKPVDGSDVQNFAPGGAPFTEDNHTTSRRTTAVKAVELAEAYIAAGIVGSDRTSKFKAVAAFEIMPANVVNDRLALLSLVEGAAGKQSTRPRGVVPQRAASRIPNMGRSAGFKSSAVLAEDSLLFS